MLHNRRVPATQVRYIRAFFRLKYRQLPVDFLSPRLTITSCNLKYAVTDLNLVFLIIKERLISIKTMSAKEPKKWLIVKFINDDKVRAVPENWLFEKDFDNLKIDGPIKEKTYKCYWPKLKFEFDLTKSVSRCKKIKSSWPTYDVIIYTTADSYDAAKKKEELAVYKSSNEIDSEYEKILEFERDKKKRKSRHKKTFSDENINEKSNDDDNEDSSSDSSDSYENDKTLLSTKEYPEAPNIKMIQGIGNSSAINVKKELNASSSLTLAETSPAKHSKLEDTFPFDDHSLSPCGSSKENSGNEGTQNENRLEKENEKSLSDKPYDEGNGAEHEMVIEIGSDELIIDECQHHDADCVDGFTVAKLDELNKIIAVPYKWQSLDFRYCYWPPERTVNIVKDFICKKVIPKQNWRKFSILQTYDYAENYANGLKIVMAARNLEEKENKTKKPSIINEIVVNNSQSYNEKSSTKTSALDMEGLNEREMMTVIYDRMQSIETKQNKILVTVQNSCTNAEGIGETAVDNLLDQIYHDIPCKTAAELQILEEKLEKDAIYKKLFKKHMKSLSSRSGHHLMQSMISAVMIDKLQVKFSFCGKKSANTKVAFNTLFLWPILRDAAVEKYINKYSVTEAEDTVKDWLKTAQRRIDRIKNKNKPKTLKDLRETYEGID